MLSVLVYLTSPFFAWSFLGGVLFHAIYFYVMTRLLMPNTFATEKTQSWLFATTTAFVTTLCSLPYLYLFVIHANHPDPTWFSEYDNTSLVIQGYFVSFLIMDLVIGNLYYKSQVNHTLQ